MTPSVLGWGEDGRAYPDKFIVNPRDGAEMVWVPAGEFTMGSGAKEQDAEFRKARKAVGDYADRAWFTDEKPVHTVKITEGFWMYRHEVTNAQFRKHDDAHNSESQEGLELNGDLQPVVMVTWEEADGYCLWAEVSLPSEAQWEYACRAGSEGKYFWGDEESEAGQYANVPDASAATKWGDWLVFETQDGHVGAATVGSFKPNAFGLHDTIGNAAEWCQDWFGSEYYKEAPEEDPVGPDDADPPNRVVRGGSWYKQVYDCRCAARGGRDATRGYEFLGFRPIMIP